MENLPSDSEMAVRLAALKGVSISEIAATANAGHGGANNFHAGFYHAPESRVPDPQRADQLMGRMAEEVSMAGRASGATGGVSDPAQDITERLAKLRGLSVRLRDLLIDLASQVHEGNNVGNHACRITHILIYKG